MIATSPFVNTSVDDIPDLPSEAVNQPIRVWAIEETRMHLEGFDFVPGSADQIWHAQGKQVDRYLLHGAQRESRQEDKP